MDMISSDKLRFTLERFLKAQQGKPHCITYNTALKEIQTGRKTTHWIWYIFPQFRDTARCSQANDYFQIHSVEEGVKYLQHKDLGPRLVEISSVAMNFFSSGKKSPRELLSGSIDAKKFHQSMTTFFLCASFAGLSNEASLFESILKIMHETASFHYCEGQLLLDPVMVAKFEETKPEKKEAPIEVKPESEESPEEDAKMQESKSEAEETK